MKTEVQNVLLQQAVLCSGWLITYTHIHPTKPVLTLSPISHLFHDSSLDLTILKLTILKPQICSEMKHCLQQIKTDNTVADIKYRR